MDDQEWFLLSFTLPKEPSRVRVSAWRKLKKCGSVNVAQSTWLLPVSDRNLTAFSEIAKDILEQNGEAYIMKASFINTAYPKDISEVFHKARDEDYKEFLDQCEYLIRELDQETQKKNCTFAEVEENEHDYEKLTDWYQKITARDFFGAPLKIPAAEALKECRKQLEMFNNLVYECNIGNIEGEEE